MSYPRTILDAPIDARKLALARRLRQQPTPTEAEAWRLLRDRRMLGLKFRRQQLVAGFIADFYCAELRLVLELDGGVHDDPAQVEYDARRTKILSNLAIDVVRVPNALVSGPALRDLLALLVERRGATRFGTILPPLPGPSRGERDWDASVISSGRPGRGGPGG